MSTLARASRRLPWWVWVAALAVAARLAFLFGADEPLLYSHPYNYFHGALAIVEHPHPWRYVLTSDDWHRWLGPWTIAPLYYLFAAGVMAVFGPHLLPLQIVQVLTDSLAALLTGHLGRRIAGRRGTWAGVAYAIDFHAIEQCASTLTENVHTILLLAGMVVLVGDSLTPASGRRSLVRAMGGGFVLGLSALARSVSTAFVPLVGLWRWWWQRDRAGALRAGLIVASAAAAVAPWTIRNAIVTGDFIPVETNGIYNLYDDNTFVEGDRRTRQEALIGAQPTLAARRALALRFALRGIAREPGAFVEKAWRNLLHLIRPDGLHLLLVAEEPMPLWRHAALILLDDAIVLPAVMLFVVFLVAGRPSPVRSLIALWTAYYLLMVVVIFHNEIRYRSTLLPFALAGAAAGWQILATGEGRRWRVRAALAAGGALVALVVMPYVVPAFFALRSLPALKAMEAAVARRDFVEARRDMEAAATADPLAARPWVRAGGAWARVRDPITAYEAYESASQRKPHVWVPIVVRPALLAAAGRADLLPQAIADANAFSWNVDPWLALETAWRELPPPVTDEVRLGDGDYGAARGFSNPFRDHRWSRHRAWLRLRPKTPATAYDVTLWMGSPEPSPLDAPVVTVRVNDMPPTRVTLSRAIAPYRLRVPAPADGVVIVRLDAPTWNRRGEPAEQGIAVSRMAVTPAP